MPRKIFTAGEVLAAADVNTFLMDQAVQTFTDSTARESAISTATAPAGLVTYLEDTDAFEYWNGTAYEAFGGTAIPVVDQVTALIVSGGGGGAASRVNFGSGGGGGGGQVAELALEMQTSVNFQVTIGAGGAGGAADNAPGSNGVLSSFFVLKPSVGVGASFALVNSGTGEGGNGGASGSGFAGGTGLWVNASNSSRGGGGGGNAAVGANGPGGGLGGNGGAGTGSTITGTPTNFGGGGGGAGATTPGSGAAGGGNGGGANTAGTAGNVNTGGGGGGGNQNGSGGFTNGGNGGSGVVILKYPNTFTITIGAGLTGTTDTVSVPDHKITTITVGTGNVSWAVA